jgi:hypothetical protein
MLIVILTILVLGVTCAVVLGLLLRPSKLRSTRARWANGQAR